MKYIFYADIFFMINFGMDYLLLRIVGTLRKRQATTSYFLGALFGAAGITLSVIHPIPVKLIQNILAYCVISIGMCLLAYGRMSMKELFVTWGMLYFCAFTAGGMISAVYYYTNIPFVIGQILSGHLLRRWNIVIFLAAAVISYLCISMGVKFLQVRMGKTGTREDMIEVTIFHRGVKTEVLALYDSGNSLTEPISGAPVHIIDLMLAEQLLKGGQQTEEKIRVIPYHSLGKEAGIMTAFECECMEITVKEETVTLGPVFLGIYRGELSAKKKYRMILNRSINKWL